MKIDKEALREASAKLRKLRLTDVGGRKEHSAETVKSVFEKGLGGMCHDEAITYALRAGIRYYIEAVEHRLAADGEYCVCKHPIAEDGFCFVCQSPLRPAAKA